jgi:hypothetical protein
MYYTVSWDNAREYCEHPGELHVPQSMFENLSGITFEDGGSDFAVFLRPIRFEGMYSYDYVEGPLLRNPGAFYAGKGCYTFGSQIFIQYRDFH